jgi:hypothetical protein
LGSSGDVARSAELNPRNPDTPIVPIVEAVDIPVIGSIAGSVDVADGADIPAVAVLLDAAVPDVAAVAAVADPIVIPRQRSRLYSRALWRRSCRKELGPMRPLDRLANLVKWYRLEKLAAHLQDDEDPIVQAIRCPCDFARCRLQSLRSLNRPQRWEGLQSSGWITFVLAASAEFCPG